jgi:adenine-specific DNA methylase
VRDYQVADTPALRKARGAFFTPQAITDFVASWAIREPTDAVLEPSCGEAAFLLASGRRLQGMSHDRLFQPSQLHGVEIHQDSAYRASTILADSGLEAAIQIADFFSCEPWAKFDAVVGNPPYVRYQNFSGHARARSLEAALAQGVRLTGLASSWAAFVIHASRFLKPSGRLGLVLPAELLSVKYAAEVRRFLLERFASVRLVMFEERVFPDVLEEVVLLLAEGTGGANCFEVCQAQDLYGLDRIEAGAWTQYRPDGREKWTSALLSRSSQSTYRTICSNEGFSTLRDWGDIYLGAVTGNNRFFALSRAQANQLRIADEDLIPISPPGARHLRGPSFTLNAWQTLEDAGARCLLFYPRESLGEEAARYVGRGESQNVDAAYKCSVRQPWWRVPLVSVPDLFLTYMNHDRPRLVANEAGVQILNSLYGVVLKHGKRGLGRDLLPIASLNSMTLLGAEVVGRAYGGGLLKLEPREADLLPIPSEPLLKTVAEELRKVKPQLIIALQQNDLGRAVDLVDRVLLKEALGISEDGIADLRAARALLFNRRRVRGRKSCGADR